MRTKISHSPVWIVRSENPSNMATASDPSAFHGQDAAGPVRGREEEAGDEGEMIDEESELVLVRRPMRWPMEGEGEEQHIGRGEQGGFREIGAGQEAGDESELEQSR